MTNRMLASRTQDDVGVTSSYKPSLIANAYVSENAAKLFTDAQAQDIVSNPGRRSDRAVTMRLESMKPTSRLAVQFYPDININVDEMNSEFNTYAFEMYGTKHLIVSGEILRMGGLFQAVPFILLGRMPCSATKSRWPGHFTYVAALIFFSQRSQEPINYLSRRFPNGVLNRSAMLFGRISAGNAGSQSANLENDPAVGCRIAC